MTLVIKARRRALSQLRRLYFKDFSLNKNEKAHWRKIMLQNIQCSSQIAAKYVLKKEL
jgi:hypothetical protein